MPQSVDGIKSNFCINGEVLLLNPCQLVVEDRTLADIDQPLPPKIVDLLNAIKEVFSIWRLIHCGGRLNLMLAHVFSQGIFVGISGQHWTV